MRDLVKPGTCALLLMLEKMTLDTGVEAMSRFGGTVLKTSLSKDAGQELQEALARGTGIRQLAVGSASGACSSARRGEPYPR